MATEKFGKSFPHSFVDFLFSFLYFFFDYSARKKKQKETQRIIGKIEDEGERAEEG